MEAGYIDPLAMIEHHAVATIRLITETRGGADLRAHAETLLRRTAPQPIDLVSGAVDGVLTRILGSLVRSGWSPGDLAELLRRRDGADQLPVLLRQLRRDARAQADLDPRWSAEIDALAGGLAEDSIPRGAAGLAAALGLAATLSALPPLPEATARVGARGGRARAAGARPAEPVDPERARKLATVRALLSKAESTTFDDEAEALVSKAQQLISRYALDRLLDQHQDSGAGPEQPGVRRLWLDAPYIGAKAQLVHEVALANGCRAVLSDPPGVSSVVGLASDTDAVELLVTSLLVQGNATMLRHGRDSGARSRTRGFRQSFLMSFAIRIGERLRTAADHVLDESDSRDRLLPILRSREDAVTDAFETLVPDAVTRSASISDAAGWSAGQVAADQALLEVHGRPVEGAREAG